MAMTTVIILLGKPGRPRIELLRVRWPLICKSLLICEAFHILAGHVSSKREVRTEAESAARQANEVQKPVGDVRSEVKDPRNALREVRELTEK
jgi:hypothetical protein